MARRGKIVMGLNGSPDCVQPRSEETLDKGLSLWPFLLSPCLHASVVRIASFPIRYLGLLVLLSGARSCGCVGGLIEHQDEGPGIGRHGYLATANNFSCRQFTAIQRGIAIIIRTQRGAI